MTAGLTPQQGRLLALLQAAEVPPTVREICERMGFSTNSPQAVRDALTSLERKGYIRRPAPSLKARVPIIILRPLPGVLSPLAKLALVRDTLEKLQRVRVDLLTRGAPVGGDAARLLAVADRDALEAIGAVLQADQAQAGGGPS